MPNILYTFPTRLAEQTNFNDWLAAIAAGQTVLQQTQTQLVTSYRKTFTVQMSYAQWLEKNTSTNIRLVQRWTAVLAAMGECITNNNIDINNMQPHYETFYIPKRSGGMRRIDAPKEYLMKTMRKIKDIMEDEMYIHPHNAAHAYVKERGTLTAIQVHQANNSRWFVKMDLKDFFPSISPETLFNNMNSIHPFDLLRSYFEEDIVKKFYNFCCLNGGLPQGTPLSPLLTNMLMTPFDLVMQKVCYENHWTYTRYADDLLISSGSTIDVTLATTKVTTAIRELNMPFTLNQDKTRYGSNAGRNWNLGLMLNKDNQITIGHKQKQRLRAGINNLLRDFTNGTRWNIMDVYQLNGNLSYLHMIEPDYCDYIIAELETKYHLNYKQVCKDLLA